MLSAIYNYVYCKLFSKPAIGRKRRIEGCNESPPKKLKKVDNNTIFSAVDTCIDFKDIMESKENCHYDKDVGCCIIAEIPSKNWGTAPTMVRKSIRKNQCKSETSLQTANQKKDFQSEVQSRMCPCSTKDIELVKYVANPDIKKAVPDNKRKSVSNRIFKSCRTPVENSGNADKNGRTFQSNMKRRINFLRESYHLAEKFQYSQLLQSLTGRPSTLFSGTPLKMGHQKMCKAPIPVIDLTKEKSNVTINRSREDVPWNSWIKNGGPEKCSKNVSDGNISPGNVEMPRVNSFKDFMKTNPVTDEDVVEQILSHHLKVSTEKRKQAAAETAKLEVLSDTNRKAYDNALEERLRAYMRVTSPAIVETSWEVEDKYKLPSLTQEQESQVSRALVASPAGQILVEKFGIQIKRRDMQTLKGLNWLNDEIVSMTRVRIGAVIFLSKWESENSMLDCFKVINFYMNLIVERGKNSKLPSVYAFNTFFYPKLVSFGHSSLKRWTKKVDIFSYDMILVPVHLGMHWCMSLIDFRSKEVRYYDSMGSENNTCLQSLLNYLQDESLDKKKVPYSTTDWKKKNVKNIPQQMNGSDCGVFSCMFAEHLARDTRLLFTQDNMPYFRRKMVLEILEGKLLT